MIRLIKFLITGEWKVHHHEWEIHEERLTNIYETPFSKMPRSTRKSIVQRCKTCGKMKVVSFGL
jgi:hypothetical protein